VEFRIGSVLLFSIRKTAVSSRSLFLYNVVVTTNRRTTFTDFSSPFNVSKTEADLLRQDRLWISAILLWYCGSWTWT